MLPSRTPALDNVPRFCRLYRPTVIEFRRSHSEVHSLQFGLPVMRRRVPLTPGTSIGRLLSKSFKSWSLRDWSVNWLTHNLEGKVTAELP